ncbi:glycoside hydrolase family 43 protein [Lutimonas saemankumensis]|uniref:glycoside hydrolase family 43 protein n=1 Tax=Lutimonas saemankumensis TaxID=483016 RepID=UPI001CD758F0|nr:glycoside hydrolase family 43 protein [Lutimonas saemankumensis]MCA0932492.1 glycoside hydrolase family 43 protein [Lutimonas saemankumensis]
MKSKYVLILICSFLIFSCEIPENTFKPGEVWLDNNGVHINAHGGGILFFNDTYYWFGEHKTEGEAGNKANVGVHCYSSKDLYNWKDEGVALSVSNDSSSLIVKGCIVERPKVIYNTKNKQFVMWFHHELKGKGYDAAMTGVALSDKITGPYNYVKSMNPNKSQWPLNYPDSLKSLSPNLDGFKRWSEEWNKEMINGAILKRDFERGQMARDMTLFVDDDGKAYHIHSSEENTTLHIAELTDDYLDFTGKYTRVLINKSNEAPAIFKKGEKYFMITSGLSGWKPNAARSAVADHPLGPWKELGNPCRGTEEEVTKTFYSQSTFVLPVQGKQDTYIFMADRWTPENAIDGRYIWLPIEFENNKPIIKWQDEWKM